MVKVGSSCCCHFCTEAGHAGLVAFGGVGIQTCGLLLSLNSLAYAIERKPTIKGVSWVSTRSLACVCFVV